MNRKTVLQELDTEIEGNLLSDRLSRMLYATDASPYQQLPLAIARPRHKQDCPTIMKWAHRRRIPIIPRAAGTSLAGQCVGEALALIPEIDVKLIPSGCCGMLGAFGYEAEHYTFSLKIAELILFPAIRQAPERSFIVASGASCRQQIADGLGVRAWHPAEVLAMALGASG